MNTRIERATKILNEYKKNIIESLSPNIEERIMENNNNYSKNKRLMSFFETHDIFLEIFKDIFGPSYITKFIEMVLSIEIWARVDAFIAKEEVSELRELNIKLLQENCNLKKERNALKNMILPKQRNIVSDQISVTTLA